MDLGWLASAGRDLDSTSCYLALQLSNLCEPGYSLYSTSRILKLVRLSTSRLFPSFIKAAASRCRFCLRLLWSMAGQPGGVAEPPPAGPLQHPLRNKASRRGGALSALEATGFPRVAQQRSSFSGSSSSFSRLRSLLPAMPMPTVSEYICDGELLPEERHAQPHYFTPKLRGVNLGGWLICEAWMQRTLFGAASAAAAAAGHGDDTDVGDEFRACQHLSREAMAAHRASWITRTDLQQIRHLGFNSVRLPVGFWVLALDGPGGDGGPPLARKPAGGASPAAKRPRKQSSLDAFFRR